ncbi:MAG TPA: protein kinase, partial [Actinomycetota bacterium]|nr:protein kinase [Actinomycetota bacterium]
MAGLDLLEGTILAGYRIVAPIGRGGMGVVYQAEEAALGGRTVALKVLSPALSHDGGFRRRFLREMRLASSIEHPNVIPVYRAGEEDGLLYIAMRYVRAADLRILLGREGRLDPGHALAIVEQVARALDAAHARGLVHRDVKPANVLLGPPAGRGEPEHVYLVDFGLARSAEPDASITGGGSFMGTPRYAAPEQIAGQAVDGRTDVYALGCVLYECLTGRPPFTADDGLAVLHAHMWADVPRISSERPGLPPELDGVVGRALAKAKEDRFPSCGELVAAARRALARPGQPAPGWPAPVPATRAEPVPATRAAEAPTRVVSRPPGALVDYQPLGRPARRARRGLAAAVFLAFAGMLVNLDETELGRWLRGRPPAAGPGGPAVAVSVLQALVFLVTAALFLVWFGRAYANLAVLGARGLRYRRWWATAGWLLPVYSLFRPKQVLNDVWRASDPELPAEAGTSWRGERVPALLGWWWLAFLASTLARSVTVESVHALASVMTFGLSRRLDAVAPSAGAQAT